jgi:hypothetical protein
MTGRHKHADVIIAWANGAAIQWKTHRGFPKWNDTDTPGWEPTLEYRIKPEPKPDVVVYANEYNNGPGQNCGTLEELPRFGKRGIIKKTFDGETGKFKAVELIKE